MAMKPVLRTAAAGDAAPARLTDNQRRSAMDLDPDEVTVTFTTRIPVSVQQEMKIMAARERTSIQAIVAQALRQYLDGRR